MLSVRSSRILAVASIGGGIFLTLISGFYSVKPLIVDAEEIYYGYPSAWLEASRGLFFISGEWHYYFLWQGFFSDFFLYSLLAALISYSCLRFVMKR